MPRYFVMAFMAVLFGSVVNLAHAGGGLWVGNGATSDWNDAANWEHGVPAPGDGSVVRFNETGDLPIEIGAGVAATAGVIVFGNEFFPAAADGTVTINVFDGGTLSVSELHIGRNSGPATLNLSSPTSSVSSSGAFVLGNDETFGEATGTVNQTAGAFTIGSLFAIDAESLGGKSGRGIYNLNGGTLHVGSTILFGPQSLIDITEGILTIAADRTGTISNAITNGKLTAYGGERPVMFDYNVTNPGLTTVWAGAAVVAVEGDYNLNGIVDAADYTVWRNLLGQTVQLPNEGADQTPGEVTVEDFNFWKSRFGAISGAGGIAAASVPEPAAILIAISGLLLFMNTFAPRKR